MADKPTHRTPAETMRNQAGYLESAADDAAANAEVHREQAEASAAEAVALRDRADEHRDAADRLDRISDGGVVVNVHVTETTEDVTAAVIDALQQHANRRKQ